MDKLLTPQEMARVLGVQPSTIYQWTHQGFIPHVKLGKFVRFKEGDVMNWVEERATDGRRARRVDVRGLGV
jgi:excisionase family DNA binding protein